jgi:DNA-binding NarL/FixJ family response regulator
MNMASAQHTMQARGPWSEEPGKHIVLSIMLVEDSVAVRTRLREILKDLRRYRIVGEFDAAPDAIAAIGSQPPDVVLLDIKLRASNGIEVLRHIKQHAPSTKVIVFSQHDDPEYREQFERAGSDFFFNKTHEAGKLVATLTALGAQ